MEAANILICEDERLVALDIEASLRRSGYNVAGIAGDGSEALRIAHESCPDLALMDIRLRGTMSGIEVARMLTEHYQVPSIYLTAYADEETLQDAKATLPLSYLLKPFDERELKSAIDIGLYRHRLQSRVETAIQSYVGELHDQDQVDKAVDLEREFMLTERTDALLRVGGNIGRKWSDYLRLGYDHLDQLSNDSELPQKHRDILKGALIHQDRALRFCDSLAALARFEKLNLEEVHFDTVVEDAMAAAKQAVKGEIQFVVGGPPEPLLGMVDRRRVVDALVELFVNAYDSMARLPEQKGAVVSLAEMLVYEEFPERFNPKAFPGWYVMLRVRDFGKGISRKYLDRVFEPGFTASGSPLSHGLGLCGVYSTAREHGGWVKLESVEGEGTTVSLFFPSVHQPGSRQRRQ